MLQLNHIIDYVTFFFLHFLNNINNKKIVQLYTFSNSLNPTHYEQPYTFFNSLKPTYH